MLLTQSTTPIIGWIATLLGYVMEFIFYCLNFIGIQNIGLCIIIFTIIVRLLMLPLTIKQQKFAKISQVMQPEINKIQRKYRNKTDSESLRKIWHKPNGWMSSVSSSDAYFPCIISGYP